MISVVHHQLKTILSKIITSKRHGCSFVLDKNCLWFLNNSKHLQELDSASETYTINKPPWKKTAKKRRL